MVIRKVALFEPEMHHEVLELLLNYFSEKVEELAILTRKDNISLIDFSGNRGVKLICHTFGNKNKEINFIRKWISCQQGVDLFIWVTLSPQWYGVSMEKLPENSLLLIHNMHYWLDYETHRAPLCYHIKTFWHQWLYFSVYRKKQKIWLSRFRYQLGFVAFPFLPSPRNFPEASPINTKLSVVIPGCIRKNGRDYGLVLQLMKRLSSNLALDFIFLGAASGYFARQLINSSRKIQASSLNIIYFDHYVPREVFHSYMMEATFLWLPLLPYRYYGGVLEKVGFSALSGGLLDAWKYQRKCFLPNWYPIPTKMKNLLIPYQTTDDILSHLEAVKR
jgi:hypothetical protein